VRRIACSVVVCALAKLKSSVVATMASRLVGHRERGCSELLAIRFAKVPPQSPYAIDCTIPVGEVELFLGPVLCALEVVCVVDHALGALTRLPEVLCLAGARPTSPNYLSSDRN